MVLVSTRLPIDEFKGQLMPGRAPGNLAVHSTPFAGQVAQQLPPDPNAKNTTEQNIMNIHLLTGPLHSIPAVATGLFLKVVSPGTVDLVPHGLTAPDVGAQPVLPADSGNKRLNPSLTWSLLNALYKSAAATAPSVVVDSSGNVGVEMTPTRRLSVDGTVGWGQPDTDTELARLSYTTTGGIHPIIAASEGKAIDIYTQPAGGSTQKALGVAANGTIDAPYCFGAASGVATLNSSSLVVQNPASKGQASGLAELSATSKVVQNPASATSTPTAASIPLAGAAVSTIDAGWLPTEIGDHTSNSFNIMRWRGELAAAPTTDLRNGDQYYKNTYPEGVWCYFNTRWNLIADMS